MSRLQLDAGLASSRDAMAATQALFEVKDADGLAKWQAEYRSPTSIVQPMVPSAVHALLLETRGILADAVKQSTSEATRQIQENIGPYRPICPGRLCAALFDVIRKSIDSQVAAMETMGKVTDQIGDIADANPRKRFKDAAGAGQRLPLLAVARLPERPVFVSMLQPPPKALDLAGLGDGRGHRGRAPVTIAVPWNLGGKTKKIARMALIARAYQALMRCASRKEGAGDAAGEDCSAGGLFDVPGQCLSGAAGR